jgi:hypothetical protein
MNLITLTMNNIKQDDKTIREVQARVERWGDCPDNVREMFYKGRCNLIKSNILSYEETKEICQKYIKPRWKN